MLPLRQRPPTSYTMLVRTTPPPFQTIEHLRFPWPERHQLKEGVPMFVLNAGSQPIIKLELVSAGGAWHEPHNGVAYLAANMLQEGTQNKHAQAIAQYIDQYGANIHVQVKPDRCSITLVTLSKHLTPMLALLTELLLEPTFDEQRLAHLKHLDIQELKLKNERNKYVARKQLKEVLFGKAHPYGRQLTEAALTNITPADLKQFYTHQLFTGCTLFVSGQVSGQALTTIQDHLGPLPARALKGATTFSPTQPAAQLHLPKKESLQAAISVGKVLFRKDHPDYLPMLVVNKLLGGYFGSRLMRNIREDKGYTYGIHAKIVPLNHTCYLKIATEVGQEFAQATCQEIEREIKLLQTVPVPAKELANLKCYMVGSFLSEINNLFALMEKFKEAHLHGLDQTYYEQLHHTIMHIDAPKVMALANQYLATESLSRVVVG